MSLINEALKKAQKQRTGDAPPLASMPSIGGEPATRIAKRSKPAGFNDQLSKIGLGAAALVAVLVSGYFVIHQLRSTPAKPVEAKPAPEAAAASVAATTLKTPLPTSLAAPAVTFNVPVAPAVVETKAPPPPAAPLVPAVTSKPEPKPAAIVAAPTTSPATALPGPAPKLGSKAVTFIETLRIAGIRASATDSKVLMNDRVYRNGDIVEHELGLKLVGITADSLTFEDEHGARYTRNF
jgi:hypothetical protein